MSELDLVPVDYRNAIRLRAWLRLFAIAQTCLVLGLVGAKLTLDHRLRERHREVEALRGAEEQLRQLKGRLAQLAQEEQDAQKRLSILSGLRGGISSSEEMFLAMDGALAEGIWFLDWTFRRAGELVEHDPKAVRTGYFIVVPMDEPQERQKAWRLETHMEIHGQTIDHSELAQFVSRLVDAPRIEQVRVVNTRVRHYTSTDVVDFELAVIVRTDA
jgi:hypothetical protein